MSSDVLISTKEVARRLDVTVTTVLRWHKAGRIPGGRKLGSNVLKFQESVIRAFIRGEMDADGCDEPANVTEPPAGRSNVVFLPRPIHQGEEEPPDAC